MELYKKLRANRNFYSILFLIILFPFAIFSTYFVFGIDTGTNVLVNSVINGATLALLALGFSIIFGIAKMFKLSIGGYYVLGAFTALWLTNVSVLNFNDLVDRPINSSDMIFLRLIHSFPFVIFFLGIVYNYRTFNKMKTGYFVGLNGLAVAIHRSILVNAEEGVRILSEKATFLAFFIVGSAVLLILALGYLELSENQVITIFTSYHIFLLAMNASGISKTFAGIYFAIMIYSILFVASVSMLVDKIVIDKIRANTTIVLIITFAIAIFLQSIIAEFSFPIDRTPILTEFEKFGIEPAFLNGLVPKRDHIQILGVTVQSIRIISMIGAIMLVSFTIWFIDRTPLGIAMQAVSQDEDAAWLVGINVKKAYLVATGIGMGLVASAAILITPYEARPYWGVYMGYFPLITAIAVVTVGGLGSIVGSVVAGFVIGYAQTFVGQLFPEYAIVVPFIVILITMIIRPNGLFGIPEEET
ncbi:MAG: branched-chain amino acid ABC transporter permease [Candidatus Heimdallarchaeota archaeon]|nr:branched-chain amino acid ABC transporter permease [Candidatus Heimdallarchaeota archaeon]